MTILQTKILGIESVKPSQQGQGLVEAVLALSFLSLILIPILLSGLYFGIFRTYLEYQSHELLVCEASRLQTVNCQGRFQKSLQSYLLYGKIEKFAVHSSDNKIQMFLNLDFASTYRWNFQKSILLPLEASR